MYNISSKNLDSIKASVDTWQVVHEKSSGPIFKPKSSTQFSFETEELLYGIVDSIFVLFAAFHSSYWLCLAMYGNFSQHFCNVHHSVALKKLFSSDDSL